MEDDSLFGNYYSYTAFKISMVDRIVVLCMVV